MLPEVSHMIDVRRTIRRLSTRPGNTAALVLSVALGAGPNVAMFTAVDRILVRPLPFPDADRLIVVHGARGEDAAEFFGRAKTLQSLATFRLGYGELTGGPVSYVIRVAEVSPSFFPLLGVSPTVGRSFDRSDEQPNAPRSVIISDATWRRSFGGDVSVLHEFMVLGGRHHTIVGVVPHGFNFPEGVDVWVAACPRDRFGFSGVSGEPTVTRMGSVGLLGRLAPATSLEGAREEIRLLHRVRLEELRKRRPSVAVDQPIRVERLRDALVSGVRPSLTLLTGGALLILLIAASNATHLALARVRADTHELAVRSALGAGWWRLVRLYVLEGALYGAMAGGLSLLLAVLALAGLRSWLSTLVPPGIELRVDGRGLAFALCLAVSVSAFVALVSAWRAIARGTSHDELTATTGTLTRHQRSWAFLVVSQVAAAVLLLIGAGQLLASLASRIQETRRTLGFRSGNVLTFEVAIPQGLYSPAQGTQLRERLVERLRHVPGVESVASSDSLPFGLVRFFALEPKARSKPERSRDEMTAVFTVTPGYLETLGIPMVAGRPLVRSDNPSAVALASVDLAARILPDEPYQHAIGQQIQLPDEATARTIIGITGAVRTSGLDGGANPQLYVPAAELRDSSAVFVVRVRTDPISLIPSVLSAVGEVSPNLPVWRLGTMDRRIADSYAMRRSGTVLLGLFALLALLLSAVGIYSVMAYSVSLRVREIGVRQALGAGPREIAALVLREGLGRAAIGLGFGVLAAAVLARLSRGLLYGAQGVGGGVYATVVGSMAVVACIACCAPLWRALRVNPAQVLRHE